jgi:hypothetical protein
MSTLTTEIRLDMEKSTLVVMEPTMLEIDWKEKIRLEKNIVKNWNIK